VANTAAAYTAGEPPRHFTSDELRARIPGWGADLDPADRPAVPQERREPTGAHWDFPERQPERWPRERSVEHAFVTPVFGTACPPKGLSGVLRKYAYRRFSEARAAHWLLLVAADRVDTMESMLRSLASARPDDPITETGILSEFRHHPIASRLGRGRADVKHMPLDPILVGAPWVVRGAAVLVLVRALRRRLR
jgi:hypothetical protein